MMNDDGRKAFGSLAFALRPEHEGKDRKQRDRDDSRSHDGMGILGQHIGAAHAEKSHGDNERHCGGRQKGKRQQIVPGKYASIQADRNEADEKKACTKEDETGDVSRTREQGGQIEFGAAGDEK